jgi:acid phosphatase family membrane protein YuiD
MAEFFEELSANSVLIVTVAAWIITQTIKVAIGIWKEKRFNFKWFVGTGGMPSSHSAGAAALATSIGYTCGLDTPLFALAFMVALVTMFDAQGVRRATGLQAEALNKIMEDIYLKKAVKEERLKELVGHTPIQVLSGAVIGILVAAFYYGAFIKG